MWSCVPCTGGGCSAEAPSPRGHPRVRPRVRRPARWATVTAARFARSRVGNASDRPVGRIRRRHCPASGFLFACRSMCVCAATARPAAASAIRLHGPTARLACRMPTTRMDVRLRRTRRSSNSCRPRTVRRCIDEHFEPGAHHGRSSSLLRCRWFFGCSL